jgi:hypothetical protein
MASTSQSAFDIAAFQRQVLRAVADIRVSRESRVPKKMAAKKKTRASEKVTISTRRHVTEEKKRLLYVNAQHFLKNRKVRRILCAALKGFDKDITSVAKKLVIVLVPLSLAGTIAMPLDPYVYGMLAYVVCKFGLAAICGDKA